MFSCLQILEAFLWFVLITLLNVTLIILRSEERFSRNAETDLVCRLLLEKKKKRRRTARSERNTRLRRDAPAVADRPGHARSAEAARGEHTALHTLAGP